MSRKSGHARVFGLTFGLADYTLVQYPCHRPFDTMETEVCDACELISLVLSVHLAVNGAMGKRRAMPSSSMSTTPSVFHNLHALLHACGSAPMDLFRETTIAAFVTATHAFHWHHLCSYWVTIRTPLPWMPWVNWGACSSRTRPAPP